MVDKSTFSRRGFLAGASAVTVATIHTISGEAIDNTLVRSLSQVDSRSKFKDIPLSNISSQSESDFDSVEHTATVTIPMYSFTDSSNYRIVAIVQKFPTGEIKSIQKTPLLSQQNISKYTSTKNESNTQSVNQVSMNKSVKMERTGPTRPHTHLKIAFDVPIQKLPTRDTFYMKFYLLPKQGSQQQEEGNGLQYLAETDPFYNTKTGTVFSYLKTYTGASSAIRGSVVGEESDIGFSRISLEGTFYVQLKVNDLIPVDVSVGKSDFVSASRNTERWTQGAYMDAIENRYCKYIGKSIGTLVTSGGTEGNKTDSLSIEQKQFEFARKFVQGFPYKKDRYTSGRLHYPQYVEETLVKGVGDCEDKAVLMAGIFEQEPFGYDTVLIFLPSHVAVGVKREDVPVAVDEKEGVIDVKGTEYVFIDSTGVQKAGDTSGRNIGNILYVYRNTGDWANINTLGVIQASVTDVQRLIFGR